MHLAKASLIPFMPQSFFQLTKKSASAYDQLHVAKMFL